MATDVSSSWEQDRQVACHEDANFHTSTLKIIVNTFMGNFHANKFFLKIKVHNLDVEDFKKLQNSLKRPRVIVANPIGLFLPHHQAAAKEQPSGSESVIQSLNIWKNTGDKKDFDLPHHFDFFSLSLSYVPSLPFSS